MSDLVTTAPEAPVPSAERLPLPSQVVLPMPVPSIEELFLFAREAELRVSTLRMTIEEQRVTARGEELWRHEVSLRHPGHARVTTRRGGEMPSRDYDVWLLDADTVTTYAAARRVVSVRPLQHHVVGYDSPDLPSFARQRAPLTALPPGSLADAFIHPHGLFRNVLVTGPLAVVGTRPVGEHEAIVVQAAHPRTAKVLVDRPDRSIEVGIGRETGFLLLLNERVGDSVTRHAEVTELLVDPSIPDSTFELRLPADVRRLF
jgi:hypothetical protein